MLVRIDQAGHQGRVTKFNNLGVRDYCLARRHGSNASLADRNRHWPVMVPEPLSKRCPA